MMFDSDVSKYNGGMAPPDADIRGTSMEPGDVFNSYVTGDENEELVLE